MPNIGQVSYSLYPTQADPGQLADLMFNHIQSFPAKETIYPGRLLAIASDGLSVQQVQATASDTTTPTPCVGFSVLLTAREGTGAVPAATVGGAVFNPGDSVPVLRKGAMFAEWKGTTQATFAWGGAVANVYHSSTVATDRGKLTDAAASSGAGTEISPLPHGVQFRQALAGSGNIALVEVNFPGAV